MTAIAEETVEMLEMLPEQEIEAGGVVSHEDIDWD